MEMTTQYPKIPARSRRILTVQIVIQLELPLLSPCVALASPSFTNLERPVVIKPGKILKSK